jgi:hypothetical protein
MIALGFMIVLHDILFKVVMDVMVVCGASGVILVFTIQANDYSWSCLAVGFWCVFLSRYLIHCSLLRIFVYMYPLL